MHSRRFRDHPLHASSSDCSKNQYQSVSQPMSKVRSWPTPMIPNLLLHQLIPIFVQLQFLQPRSRPRSHPSGQGRSFHVRLRTVARILFQGFQLVPSHSHLLVRTPSAALGHALLNHNGLPVSHKSRQFHSGQYPPRLPTTPCQPSRGSICGSPTAKPMPSAFLAGLRWCLHAFGFRRRLTRALGLFCCTVSSAGYPL